MISRFKLKPYLDQLVSLVASSAPVKAIENCLANTLAGFEPSSRSVSMLCHSVKMAAAMKVGSKLENAARLTFEHSSGVAGYYFKVGELGVRFSDGKGQPRGVLHRPDALRLLALPSGNSAAAPEARDFIRFAEIKNSQYLDAAIKDGDRYSFDSQTQRYRSAGSERAALETYGFGYDILTERDFDPVITANVEFLQVYFRDNIPAVPAVVVSRAQEKVMEDQGISLPALIAAVDGLSVDRFYKLIVDGKLYVSLKMCQLDMPSAVQVFTDRLTCEALGNLTAGTKTERLVVRRFPRFEPNEVITIRGKNFVVVVPGTDHVQFRTDMGDSTVLSRVELDRLLKEKQISSLGVPRNNHDIARQILLSTPPEQLLKAVERCNVVGPVIDGKATPKEMRDHLPNFATWLARGRQAYRDHGQVIVGLIDGRNRQGYRGSHLSPMSEAAIDESIRNSYATNRAAKKCSAYTKYRELCKERGVTPVSEKTFGRRIRRFASDFLKQRREGSMAAAAVAAPVDHETLLMGGGRWFLHVVQADEFVVDLALVLPELGLALGTAWAVVMIDSYTRTVLAICVSFEEPSYVTTMALLRECVARWGRLPENLFLDNGAGFKNLSLVLFANYYKMGLFWRPPGMARWGAEVERFAGDFNQRVANELPGATKTLNQLRRISKSHHPQKLATFCLHTLAEVIREWSYSVFDTLPHAGLHGKSPREMRTISPSEHGDRVHLKISDDPLFEIISLPAPEGDGKAKVQAHNGVQVANLYYWHERFYDSELVGTRVDVRYDPFDITKVYAFVKDEWIQCDCIKLLRLRRLPPVDLCAATLEIRKGRTDYNKRRTEILEKVEAFLGASAESAEEVGRLLRTKESARQFLARTSPGKITDGEDDSPAGAPTAAPKPPPSIPGFTANIHP